LECASLQTLIDIIEQGTLLHICILFVKDYHNEKLVPAYKNIIHSSPFCFASKEIPNGYDRCLECKKKAIQKLFDTKAPYFGYCVNGAYEYCYPILDDNEVSAVIFIGNILEDDRVLCERSPLQSPLEYASTMEKNISHKTCFNIASVLESYIKLIVMTHPPQSIKSADWGIATLMKEYADSNFMCAFSLSQLAEIYHYNEKYLGRIFKMTYNISFKEYVNLKRLQYSKNLLKFSKSSIIDISLKSGFNNVTYFNRLFKSHYGITPSEYRAQMLKFDQEHTLFEP